MVHARLLCVRRVGGPVLLSPYGTPARASFVVELSRSEAVAVDRT